MAYTVKDFYRKSGSKGSYSELIVHLDITAYTAGGESIAGIVNQYLPNGVKGCLSIQGNSAAKNLNWAWDNANKKLIATVPDTGVALAGDQVPGEVIVTLLGW